MNKNLKAILATALVGILVFPACKPAQIAQEESEELFVVVEGSKIERFDTIDLELTPETKSVAWSSSDESVVVIENGKLTGLKEGTAVISATSGNKKQEQTITVIDGGMPIIDVDYLPIIKGDVYEMNASAYFKGKELEGESFSYSVENTSVATIENNVLSGIAYGETTVTISLSWRNQANVATKTVPCKVTKNCAVYTDKAEYVLYTVDSVLETSFPTSSKIQTKGYYEGEAIEDLPLVWTIDDASVAMIEADGTVTAISAGETYAVASCEYNGEVLSTREIPIKVEKPYLKTNVSIPVKKGDKQAEIDAETALGLGYNVGKVVFLDTGLEYACTENRVDLSNFGLGEYSFAVYEENEAFATQVNLVVADYVVTDAATLLEATRTLSAYVALAKDIDVGSFKTLEGKVDYNKLYTGTFNGLGHTITATYDYGSSALYSLIGNFTFKNLSIICTINTKQNCGALFYQARGDVVVDNCYIETTITHKNAKVIGGVCDSLGKAGSLTMNNTIVKVNGLNRTEAIQEACGAILARMPSERKIFFNQTYVIADGLLCSNTEVSSAQQAINQTKIIYKDEAAFARAKEKGKINLETYNHCWDLSGIIPQFK